MRFWVDAETGNRYCEPDCCDEWLELIWQIGYDYDGYHKAEDLKDIIDELVEISKKARACLHDGKLFVEDK